jgi:hypothetical protein
VQRRLHAAEVEALARLRAQLPALSRGRARLNQERARRLTAHNARHSAVRACCAEGGGWLPRCLRGRPTGRPG